MARVLGIDLGTTNSCVAVVENGTPMLVPTQFNQYTLPSMVGVSAEGEYLIGRVAKRQAVVNAENTVFGFKRLMGRSAEDPVTQEAIKRFPFRCVPGDQSDVRVQLRERVFAIQELSAMILSQLRAFAESHFDDRISKAVITVPAYFNDLQRQATVDAAAIAGLECLRITNEPTAAALAYGALQKGQKHLAVYDLGGGTFDVSILRVNNDLVEVMSSSGDAFLGGIDFDNRIVDWLTMIIEQNYGVSPKADRSIKQRLLETAESTKIALSDTDEAEIVLPFLATDRSGQPINVETSLTRQTYESLVKDLVDTTFDTFERTLKDAGLQPGQVDEILLVGGMTRTPLVRQRAEVLIGKEPGSGVHPDLVVAVGAAIQGSMLAGGNESTILVDVTPHNLGIMTMGGHAEVVIGKDTSIPTDATKVFTTVRDNQSSVKIVVYQGDSRLVANNQILGTFSLDDIPPGPRGAHQIEVTFQISADGIVSVKARDRDTGQERAIQVGSQSLEKDELERMSQQHQEQFAQAQADLPAVVGEN